MTNNLNDDENSKLDKSSPMPKENNTKSTSKRTKKMKKKEKRIQKEKDKQKKKLEVLEKKSWLSHIIDKVNYFLNKTMFFYTIEFKCLDKFPRKEAREFKQNFIGLVTGIIITYLFFFLLIYTFRRDLLIALYFCMVLLVLATFGISFSNDIKCIFVLIGPCLTSSRLRWFLLMYASGLTALGPGLNTMRNALSFRSSVMCVYDQIKLNILVIKMITKAPFRLIMNNIKDWINAIREIWHSLRESVGILKFGLFNSGNTVSNQVNFFQVILNACNDKVALYNQCILFFNNIYHSCYYKLIIFKELCYFIRYGAKEFCKKVEDVSEICDNAKMKLNKLNVSAAMEINQRIEVAFEKLNLQIGTKATTIINNTPEKKEDIDNVKVSNVSENLKQKSEKLLNTVTNFRKWMRVIVMIWTIIGFSLLFIQAALFRKHWLKKDSFQNVYLTKAFAALERDAYNNGRQMVLPLIGPEKNKYISLSSNHWAKFEKSMATRGVSIIFLSALSMISMIVLDYFMYLVLLIMEPIFESSYKADKSVQLQIVIGGISTIGSFVKAILSVLGPLKDIVTDVDLPICKPVPREPNIAIYLIILAIVILTIISLVFQVRILRYRHHIMIEFYPERSIYRALWLKNYILSHRGTTTKFLFATISNKFKKKKGNIDNDQNSLVGKLILKSKIWEKLFGLFGKKRVFCFSCNAEGDPKSKEEISKIFTQCTQCHSLYCKSCYTYLKYICVICQIPLEVSEVEIDMHKLTSDEDYEDFKTKYVTIIDKDVNN